MHQGGLGTTPQLVGHFIAIDVGQVDIQQDQIDFLGLGNLDAFQTGGRLQEAIATGLQGPLDQHHVISVVFNV